MTIEIEEAIKAGKIREAIKLIDDSRFTLEDIMREIQENNPETSGETILTLFSVASRMSYISLNPANLR